MTAAAPLERKLRKFQHEGVAFLENRARAMLADEPGLGKTAQLLCAARGRTLVVAPAMVLDGGVWDEEESRWQHLMQPSVDIHHLSYHQVVRQEDWIRRQRFETVVWDESHYLKEPHTHWTETAIRLAPRIPRFFLASGTPIPNWSYELWTTLRMLYPGDRRWSSRWRWIEGWFKVNEESHPVKLRSGKIKMISHRAIGDLLDTQTWEHFREWNLFDEWLIRRLRRNHLHELPPVTEQYIKVAMTKVQKQFYDRLKADYVAWVAETGTEVSAWSDGGLHTKLCQVLTGVATVDPEMENLPLSTILASGGKYRMVQELLRDRGGQPTVIFCFFRRTARILRRIVEDLGLSVGVLMGAQGEDRTKVARYRRDMVRNFQQGGLDVLIGTIETISEGLTLTAADCAIFVERSWKPYKNQQARFRLDRMGQQHPVNVIYLISPGLDTRMTEVLAEKDDQQIATLTAGDFGGLLAA